ncbi:DUF4097 family beta strand repeat-containing protein [Liquorilactobacillus hordei]|nr:DUF4097 family beta strand repeat-containing protein [Liquorilactobacillus hordei]QYH52114.1 DUF4097 domain-containing protein [Liquorilactobacillus hordei DSM 19519]
MKKTIIIGFFIMVIGLLLTGYGYIKNGAKPLYIDGWKPKVATRIEKKQILSKNVSFDKINVNDTINDIVITRGSHFQISYQGNKKYLPTVSISNGILNIQQKKSLSNYISISGSVENSERVIITVPKTATLQDIGVTITEGDLSIQNIKTQKISVDDTDGDISIGNLTAGELKIDNEDGDVDVTAQSQITNGTFSLVDGDLTAHESSFTNVKMTNSDGDISLYDSTINGGELKLTDGDFEGTKIGITGELNVVNNDGDNSISLLNDSGIGYSMSNEDGDNTLFGKGVKSRVSSRSNQANQIKLINISGDNEIK